MSNGNTEKSLVPSESKNELRARIDAEVPALVGGFQLGPRRLRRVGKVRLGYKVSQKRASDGKEVTYPKEASWFVFDDPEVEAALVAMAKPSDVIEVEGAAHVTALEIIFPCNVIKDNAEVVYAAYNSKQLCLCTSKDGVTARQTNPETGEVTEIACLNESCPKRRAPENKRPACSEVMRVRFIIPSIPPLGVWQLDTGSTWSKNSLLGYMRMLQAEITSGQLAGIRLRLSRVSEMIADKTTKQLQQHWPLHIVANVSFNDFAQSMAEARVMTYKPEDIEEFDESPDETIVPANGDQAGAPIIDADTGEITLPGEEPIEAEVVEEPEPAAEDEPAPAEPPKPTVKPINNEQVNAILKLAEKTWTDRKTAAESFKTWLGQMFDGQQSVRQLNYQQACKCVSVLQSNLSKKA